MEEIIKTKVCKQCERDFPLNTDYYFKKCDTKDGFSRKCKECQGTKFTNKLTHIPKDGYKFCIKCDRELLVDIKYFPPDKTCPDGLRNVCRECGKDGYFMGDDYKIKHFWTNEEEKLFVEVYPNFMNEELIQLYFPNESLKSLTDKAFKLGKINKTEKTMQRMYKLQSERYSGENSWLYGIPKSEESKRKISLSRMGRFKGKDSYWFGRKRSEKQKQQISFRRKGEWAGDKNPRHINPLNGAKNGRWVGGISNLSSYLRRKINDWKYDSLKSNNFKCFITGINDGSLVVHHLYSFSKIVRESLNIVKLPLYSEVSMYTNDQLKELEDKCVELHYKKGLGKPIIGSLHKLFHIEMGNLIIDNGELEEFREKYMNFEFDNILDDKYKYCNVVLKELVIN
jgi:hypothetical protein